MAAAVTSYTQRTLIPGEQIIYAAKLHWACYFLPVLLLLVGAVMMSLPFIFGYIGQMEQFQTATSHENVQQAQDFISGKMAFVAKLLPPEALKLLKSANELRQFIFGFIFIFFGLLYLLKTYLKKRSTEQVITNKKIIHKKGFIKVDETEIALANVEAVKVFQSVLDRLLKRGNVLVNGVGMEQIELKGIALPNKFRHAAYTALDHYANYHHQPVAAAHAPQSPGS